MLFPNNAKALISKTFYDKEVSVLAKTDSFDSEGGLSRTIASTGSTFLGNVRYVNHGEVQAEKGLVENIDVQITCPTDTAVAVDDILQYESVKYVAVEVLQYDSHKLILGRKWQA